MMLFMTLLSLASFGCKPAIQNLITIDHKLYIQHMVKLLLTNCRNNFLPIHHKNGNNYENPLDDKRKEQARNMVD